LEALLPEGGIDPAWLARPLGELGRGGSQSSRSLRVEMPPSGRWSTSEAAFLARCVTELEPSGVKGLPHELTKLLGLARTVQGARGIEEPVLSAGRYAAEVTAFLALLGEIVLYLPRFLAGRARMRRADVVEALAESSSRALPIVAVTNLLMGAILAFVGAVQLNAFGAGIYVANLVGIASVRELTPILTAIVLAGRTGSFVARIATMRAQEVDALTAPGVRSGSRPRVVALGLLMPFLYVYGCARRPRRDASAGLSSTYPSSPTPRRRSWRSAERISPSAASNPWCSASWWRSSAAIAACARRAARRAWARPPRRQS
jgi:phospholipid/cholesterol/gamma-HCH transport system permease protein